VEYGSGQEPIIKVSEPQVNKPQSVEATARRFLTLAVPIMLAHITEPLLGLVDTIAIGRLNDIPMLGAVAIGAVFFDFIFWGLGSLRPSTAGLTAQAFGAGSAVEVRLTLYRALTLSAILGLILIIMHSPISDLALYLLAPSAEVNRAARIYITIRIWAAPFAFANYAILGSLIGRGRTDIGLILQVAINSINVVLAILLVIVAGFGIEGAAVSALIGDAVGSAIGLSIIARLGGFSGKIALKDIFNGTALKRLLVVNVDIMIRAFALLTAFGFFTSQSARLGDITLAANQVLNMIFLVSVYFLDGYATAGEQLCGQAIGARDEADFRKSVFLVVNFSFWTGLVLTVGLIIFGNVVIAGMAANMEIRDYAGQYLIYAAMTPVAGALAFAFDGIYIGSTWTKAMRNLMLLSLALYFVVFALVGEMGNSGLWISILAFLLARGIAQALAYPVLARRAFSA
jgi:MATE family multidrug resistance protein